ncbi:MAG: NAD(P)/FAD-dependent oxidoreductase [Candidatus Promineifilaceae bacterium]|nr:NAD(P)/FAD-dependent oxidoreductase [Candidatus Promineifilaceae bacterium]
METNASQRVCVIGAGLAGLATAKVLQADGFDVTVFEKVPRVGGVWLPSRTYPELRTNTAREEYAFSDFPQPESADDYPTADQVLSYIESYVDHFELHDAIHLSTEVTSVSRAERNGTEAHPGFQVTVRPSDGSGEEETHHFDFVAVCNGLFSDPYIPQIEGTERFSGSILHSSQFTDAEMVEGKRVIVVGAGKSAVDCAAVAAKHARSCTSVFRSPKWMMPQYLGGIRSDWLFFNRFTESLYRYHHLGPIESIFHGPLRPLLRLYWRIQRWTLQHLFLRIPSALVPDKPLRGSINVGVGADFYEAVREEKVVPKRAEIDSFAGGSTVELSTGEQIEADLVIFATGYQHHVPFLDKDLRDLVREDGHFHLYRRILPPEEHRLGFVGYTGTFINSLVIEIAAHWLSECFLGELDLPGKDEMEREIEHVRQWSEEHFPSAKGGLLLGPFTAHYVDDLMRDMDLEAHRTDNLLAEHFGRLLPSRYKDVGRERRQARRKTDVDRPKEKMGALQQEMDGEDQQPVEQRQ